MNSYEDLLKRGKEKLPELSASAERFVIPNVRGHIEGNKTIISNFLQIAQHIGRKPEHVLKFVLKELATPGEIKKQFVVFGTKVPASRINEKIQKYFETFVSCKECGKPDTKMTKEGDVYFLKCSACGARYSVYAKN
ncbi:translation initiation factor IF-2 subunit beta [Candidatus Woesearchaeota archaeon]|nr:translation initiation factor IF-2 subunit beta [Candidatus Woesearchaeota archaeon]